MAVRKLKGSWWVDFQVRHERHRYRSPENTRQGALAYEALLRQKLARGESLGPAGEASDELYSSFADHWFQTYAVTNNKPSERENKRRTLDARLKPFFGKFHLSEITSQRIEAFKATELARGIKAKTINNYLAILRKSLNTAVEWGKLASCPRIKPLKAENPKYLYLSHEEANCLIAAAPEGFWRTMLLTALRTGMRFSELAGLEWDDVDFMNRQICVRRANVRGNVGTPKNNRSRYIPMTEELTLALSSLPRRHPLVFAYADDWMRYEVGRLNLAKSCKVAGIKVVAWHALRHTFASQLASSGVPLSAIQRLLGHSTINMTMRYSHLSQNDLREAVAVLEKSSNPEKMSTWRQPQEISIEKLLSKIAL